MGEGSQRRTLAWTMGSRRGASLSGQWAITPGARDLVFLGSSGLCLKICYKVKIVISAYGTRGVVGSSLMKCLEQSPCTQLSAM